MEFVVGFKQEKPLKSVNLNALIDIGAYIFPIKSIVVEGSKDSKNFEKLTEVKFPDGLESDPRGAKSFNCDFPEGTSFQYYKFTVANLKKLPSWHRGKGEPAWIFIDELFLN